MWIIELNVAGYQFTREMPDLKRRHRRRCDPVVRRLIDPTTALRSHSRHKQYDLAATVYYPAHPKARDSVA